MHEQKASGSFLEERQGAYQLRLHSIFAIQDSPDPPAQNVPERRSHLQAAGYVARSAYKLLEIQQRHKIITPGVPPSLPDGPIWLSALLHAASCTTQMVYGYASLHLSQQLLACAGAHVLDLGCSPGAWLQVACQAIGPPQKKGCVVGVDLQVSDLDQSCNTGHGAGALRCWTNLAHLQHLHSRAELQ